MFALHTGIRRGEILNLRWSHVDLSRHTLTILEQKMARGIRCRQMTRRWMSYRPEPRCGRTAQRRCTSMKQRTTGGAHLLRAFYTAMRKTGIARFRFHDLRHTFATRLIQAGVNVYYGRYAHHQPEEVLDRLRQENGTQ